MSSSTHFLSVCQEVVVGALLAQAEIPRPADHQQEITLFLIQLHQVGVLMGLAAHGRMGCPGVKAVALFFVLINKSYKLMRRFAIQAPQLADMLLRYYHQVVYYTLVVPK